MVHLNFGKKDQYALLLYARQPSVKLLVTQSWSLVRISTPLFDLYGASILAVNRGGSKFLYSSVSDPEPPERPSVPAYSGGRVFVSLTRRSDMFKSEEWCHVSCLIQCRPLALAQHFVPFSSSSRTDDYCSAWRLSVLPPDASKPLTSSKTNSVPTHRQLQLQTQCREDNKLREWPHKLKSKSLKT